MRSFNALLSEKSVKQVLRHTVTNQSLLQTVRHEIRLAEMSLDCQFTILKRIFRYLIAVKAVIFTLTALCNDAFRNVHAFPRVIFKLVSINHNRKRLRRLSKRRVEVDRKTLLTKQSDSKMCRSCRSGMDG